MGFITRPHRFLVNTPELQSDWTSNIAYAADDPKILSHYGVTVTKPAGVSSGDLLLIIAANDRGSAEAWGSITGFTEFINIGDSITDCQMAAWWRIADGTEGASEYVSGSNEKDYLAWYMRVTGAHQTTPINGIGSQAGVGAGTSINVGAASGTATKPLTFCIAAFDGADTTLSFSGGDITEEDFLKVGTSSSAVCGIFGTNAGESTSQTVNSTTSDGIVGIQFEVANA